MKSKVLVSISLLVFLAAGYLFGISQDWFGEAESAGQIRASATPEEVTREIEQEQINVMQRLARQPEKQILFGDLHVHTTFSSDAFRMSLPMVQGDGAHPPADACDFARVCSALDFWALTDHAESLTAARWQESIASVQQCNALAGNPENPDLVTFMGFEWTQASGQPESHYGHKNVIFPDAAEDQLPARPISSPFRAAFASIPLKLQLLPPLRDLPNRQRYYDFNHLVEAIGEQPLCAEGVHVHDLPTDCAEVAATPDVLFEKLDQWGLDSIVIPHGNAWGVYSPAGTSWDKQLAGDMHDPQRQTLIEVFSGHGNSEEHRDWRAVGYAPDGSRFCPEPRPEYLPSCWRAGELIHQRCEAAGLDAEECEWRAKEARQNYVDNGQVGWHTVPGTQLPDWLDAGQCRDCFLPAFNYRPGGSAQYALAIGNFDQPGDTKRFRFGFIASSDNHSARPGTGYKQFDRHPMTDWWGYSDADSRQLFSTDRGEPGPQSVKVDASQLDVFNILEMERQTSYFVTGGLVAAHASGRDRDSIWDALKRKEVYGTSGQRMLLWFDLLNGPEGTAPMGTELDLSATPRFRVQALGAFEQLPGCPDYSVNALDPERLELLCRGECHNPSKTRVPLDRIEVIRIRPQVTAGESVSPLIEDPWLSFDCKLQAGPECVAEFEDAEFAGTGRDTVYYVRAVQRAQASINAAGLRCESDEDGQCKQVKACYGDYRTDPDDDCLAAAEHRAWSSPIFIDYDASDTAVLPSDSPYAASADSMP